MRNEKDIREELESNHRLRAGLNAEGEALHRYDYYSIWMDARAALSTPEKKKMFDLWMQAMEKVGHLKALEWVLNDNNPKMVSEGEKDMEVPYEILHKIEFYHGIHTHKVCQLKGNLHYAYREKNQEKIDKTLSELRKYIPGI